MRTGRLLLIALLVVWGLLADGRVSVSNGQRITGAGIAAADTAPVVWLLFADDLHLDFVRTGQLRDIFRTAASTLRQDGALVVLGSSGPSMVSFAPSSDAVGLDAAIRRFAGNGLKASDFLVGFRPAITRELRHRAQVALSTLHSAVANLASTPGSRKHVVFVSHGFTIVQPARPVPLAPQSPGAPPLHIDDGDLRAEIGIVAKVSLASGVRISALDPRFFMPGALDPVAVDPAAWQSYLEASHHNLRELTTPTGGSLLDGTQPLTDTLLALRVQAQR
jgi:hypothetical protein